MKFKVGDLVVFIGTADEPPYPTQGVVNKVWTDDHIYRYECSFGGNPNWAMKEDELEFRKEEKIQRILDKIDGKLHKS